MGSQGFFCFFLQLDHSRAVSNTVFLQGLFKMKVSNVNSIHDV